LERYYEPAEQPMVWTGAVLKREASRRAGYSTNPNGERAADSA
jgi:hypothetical protein